MDTAKILTIDLDLYPEAMVEAIEDLIEEGFYPNWQAFIFEAVCDKALAEDIEQEKPPKVG